MTSEAGSWIEKNTGNEECILCWSSDRNYLKFDDKNLVFHTVDRALLCLVDKMINEEKDGVFVYPVNDARVSVPLCIEALYHMMQINSLRRKVLLISDDIAVRSLYSKLKTNWLELNKVFALGIVKIDGSVKKEIHQRGSSAEPCLFLHTSNTRCLPSKEICREIGCVIIDATSLDNKDIEIIMEWADNSEINTLVFLESNPYSDNLKIFREYDLPILGWDSSSLTQDFEKDLAELQDNSDKYRNPFSLSVFQIRNWVAGIKREFVIVEDPEVIPLLDDLLHMYFEVSKLYTLSPGPLLLRARYTILNCKYAFERLLAPLSDTEKELDSVFVAKPLHSRIKLLADIQRAIATTDPSIASFISHAQGICQILYDQLLRKDNPKFVLLKKIIVKVLESRGKILVITYNEPHNRALLAALQRDLHLDEEALHAKGLSVMSPYTCHIDEDYDKCVIFGQVPLQASWLLRTACAKEITFLVYPSEKALLKKQFETEERKFSSNFGIETRIEFVKKILGVDSLPYLPPSCPKNDRNSFQLNLTAAELEEEKKLAPLMPAIEEDEDAIAIEEVSIDDSIEQNMFIEETVTGTVSCCRVNLEHGGTICTRPSGRLPILKDGKSIEYIEVQKVKPGSALVIIKNSIRNNLAKEIIKKADTNPAMQRIKFLVETWRAVLRKGMIENKDTFTTFLKKLNELQDKEHRQRITTELAIYFWREGYVIGPQDSHNIKFIGEIYNQKFLVDNYKEVYAAICRLRELHQKILSGFNAIIMSASLKQKHAISDEVIDAELNLHIEDFANIISIERISSIETQTKCRKQDLYKLVRS